MSLKVLIYAEASKVIKISGIGCAISHQKRALELNNIEYTTNPKEDYDVVHINTYGLASRKIAKKARRNGKLVVYHAHSTEEDFRDSFVGSNLIAKLFKKWIVSCYNLGDVIVTPSEYSKQLLEGYGITKPIYAVSNGIDLSYYEKAPNDRAEFRKEFGYSESDKVVMSVGLFFERKGLLDFVKMAELMPEYQFIWFGKTPLCSVPYKIRKAVKTKLPNLKFAGFVSPDILKKAYHGANLFAFLTKEETEGIVLLEALASRQNVLIRDIPIYKTLLTNGKNAYKADDLESFCYTTRAILNHTVISLGEQGYQVVLDKDIAEIGLTLTELYEHHYALCRKRILYPVLA
ncbi:MAG: glycosyltransferase [Oscillospiraceae bacterium]